MNRKRAVWLALAGSLLCFAYAAWATLPSSGQISMAQVNTELGLSSTAALSLGTAAVRTLAGVPSGAISMDNLHGKSSLNTKYNGTITVGNVSIPAPPYTSYWGLSVSNGWGSRSPTTLTDGKTLAVVADRYDAGTPVFGVVTITGFSSDPGAAYLYSVKVKSNTVLGTSMFYGYDSGSATWTLSGAVFGITQSSGASDSVTMVGPA